MRCCFHRFRWMQFTKTGSDLLSFLVAAQWMPKSLPAGRQPNMCQYGWVIAHFYFCSPSDIPVIGCLSTGHFFFYNEAKWTKCRLNFIRCGFQLTNVGALELIICHNNMRFTNSVICQMCHIAAMSSGLWLILQADVSSVCLTTC